MDGAGFRRLRIGIDRPANQNDVADYVLSTFKPDEKKLLAEQEEKIQSLINEFLLK
ncbi:hypothetical protein GW864_05205 [bacterium]|nr:hypothetical protein [bacterium]